MTKATFNLDENVASAACYVLGWLTGIIFFLMEKENKTVRFHAMQSIIAFLSLSILSYIFGWISGFLSLLISLLTLILWLVLMIKAYQGEKFKLPIVGDIAEGQA